MIALAATVTTAAPVTAPAFAPPLGRALAYRTVERHPLSDGSEAVVTSHQRLRFDRDAGGRLIATVLLERTEVTAPPRARLAIEAAADALHGVPLRVVVAPNGSPGAVLDPARGWAAVEAGYRALDARILADPMLAPDTLAAGRDAIAAERARPPAAREARLRGAVAPLLPPPLPALRPGETRPLTTTLLMSDETIDAAGTLQLVAATPAALRYRTVIASAAADGVRAAAAIRARLADAAPATRPQLLRSADALEHAVLREESELTLDRATGLVVALHERQGASGPGGAGERPAIDRTITLETILPESAVS